MPKRLLVLTDRIGRSDDELGRVLTRNFFYSLARAEDRPASIGFMNEGVRLTCEGSEVLDDLRLLAEDGVSIKSCGTCLDYLNLKESLAVGEVGTMSESMGFLFGEGEVVTLA
ncbi:MAG: sulfurtransferase-like selenium metabolism protein YedF [Coriobacteriia bacterium]|nr:sulfurtransferase-like selenium metabolism protein YedF [Coriobacteriia bacterium]